MNGPEMLAKWLTGMGYTNGLLEYIKQFEEAKHTGIIYRGLYFDHYPSVDEIKNSDFCSWSTDIHVAEYFASHKKYGFVVSKRSTGYDIHKILNILRDLNELPDRLKNYRTHASEMEIVDCLNVEEIRLRRVGIK